LLARRKLAELRETPPMWLPDYAVAEGQPLKVFSLLALALGLARELSGEASLDRAAQAALTCECQHRETGTALASGPAGKRQERQTLYVELTEKRFGRGMNRCC
jgi:hypothetical protein